jgi:arylsulfatase A-like enzyme
VETPSVSGVAGRFARILGAVAVLGLVQAALETLVIAALYARLLFAPYRFFTIQIYDAFTKLYFLLAEYVSLPEVLDTFVAQGVLPKLMLFPELAAVNVAVALPAALFLLVAEKPLGLSGPNGGQRVVAVVTVVALFVHVAFWLALTKIPAEPTLRGVAANLARDAIYDGVAFSVAIAIAAGLIAAAALRREVLGTGAAIATVLLATLGVPAAVGGAPRAAAEQARAAAAVAPGYNVILISVDSLRADRTSLHGHERPTTPSLEAMAEAGVMFESCRSTTSWTLPAHMSMLTGRSLLGHGVVSDDRRLGDDVPTLAESFARAGYVTGAIVSAPYVEARYGFDRGFSDYDDDTISFATNNESYKSVTAPLLNETAEKWIGAHARHPFFLFLHYWDVHYDFAPGPPYDTMFDPDYEGQVDGSDFYFNPAVHRGMDRQDLEHVMALYDGEIRLVDDHIGKLIAGLERVGVANRTVVVVTSDHGEEFFEHGRKGHHRTLYEEVLHVPLVMQIPGYSPRASRIAADSSIVDIMPTLLGLVGIEPPEGLEGTDFAPVITGESQVLDRPIFAELYRKGSRIVEVAAIDGAEKIIHHFNHRWMESFDLAADPGEMRRLSNADARGSPLLEQMRRWLNKRWRGYAMRLRTKGVDPLELDDASEEALRALGYIE